MKIQRLRVEQLRQFRQPLEITDFGPGINLFCGPNESGKSTLVQAIRAAFFEKHRSSVVSDLQPWGDSSAAPEIAVDFTHHNQSWRLVKRFLQRKRCDLTVDTQAWSGEEAEDKLAALLGFKLPSKGASKAEHWGIPGLLWIEQGQGQAVETAVKNASDHLKSALGASLGEMASSNGDQLMAAVEAECAKLLTPRTGRPSGNYQHAVQAVRELTDRLASLDQQIAHYRQQVDQLGTLRQLHRRDETDRPWEALRQKQQAAQVQFDQVTELTEQQAADQKAHADRDESLQLIGEQLTAYQQRADQLADRARAHDRAREALAELAAQRAPLHNRLEQAQAAYVTARDRERQIRQQAQRQSLVREQQQVAQQETALKHRLAQAQTVQTELTARQQEQAEARVDPRVLKQLRRVDAELRDLQVQQKSIATRLKFVLEPGKTVHLGDQAITDNAEELLLQETELHLPGLGVVRIMPGGSDLGDLARNLEKTNEQHQALRDTLNVSSLSEAEQQAERIQRLDAAIDHHRQLLKSHAPEGIDALQSALAQQQARAQVLADQLAALPAALDNKTAEALNDKTAEALNDKTAEALNDKTAEALNDKTAEALNDKTAEALDNQIADAPDDRTVAAPEQAERALANAEQALKQAEADEQAFQREFAKAEQQTASAAAEHERLTATLADPAQAQRRQELEHRLVEQRAERRELEARVQATRQRIEAAQPELLRQDIQRFGSSAEQAENAFREREKALAGLQAELNALGAQGLEEDRALVSAELDAETRRHDQLKLRAEATSLLLDLLKEKRHQLTRQLQAPLQKHLNRYVRLLFPDAELEVDDNLMPGRLLRTGALGPEAGDFADLSFGAREQMGLISRLAYADLLQEAGQPTLLMLDDALVHSDAQRLDHMKRILFDAGQRHQILLFTCHPERWSDLGVAARDLRSLQTAGELFPA